MKELQIEAKTEAWETVLEFITTELESVGCAELLQTQILIAAEEIFVNIAHYAYNPETGGAVIRICVGDEVIIEFEDNGKPYNPLERADPDITLSAEEREVGGLGIFMVKDFMDTVKYRHEGNKNILIIKKTIV
jgi:anti-sigma regulatory factor (Ser/Thr protein kinase)